MMPRLLGSSKITARHQITLSEEVMKALKVKEGDVVDANQPLIELESLQPRATQGSP